jgi:adenylosuccinate lyase
MNGRAILAGAIERLATELRHLQRQEVDEVAERFSATQKGSSAMPHKRNPIVCENLTGLARLIRASAIPVLEKISRYGTSGICPTLRLNAWPCPMPSSCATLRSRA